MEKKSVPPFYLVKIGKMYEAFQSEAANFVHIMANGGGLVNMNIKDSIEKLNDLYRHIAAHIDAARDIDRKANLESGIEALEYIRTLEAEEKANKNAAS